jgi:hypothetical protein
MVDRIGLAAQGLRGMPARREMATIVKATPETRSPDAAEEDGNES